MKVKLYTTAPRDYNHLLDKGDRIIKSSLKDDKIKKEVEYFEKLDPSLKEFHVNFLGSSSEGKFSVGYVTEKVPQRDMSIYLVENKQVDQAFLKSFFRELRKYFNVLTKKESLTECHNAFEKQIIDRSKRRISQLKDMRYYKIINSIFTDFGGIESFNQKIIASLKDKVSQEKRLWSSHGDLCFSNIIFNGKLNLLDPRGADEFGFFLSPYYDFAKLSQCILGGYDFINHKLDRAFDLDGIYKKEFLSLLEDYDLDLQTVRLVECLHFLAMLPLHLPDHEKVDMFAKKAIAIAKEIGLV